VEHGETGLLFAPGDSADLADKLASLIADPPLRERLGRNAAEIIRARFTLTDAAAAMGRIYNSFLA
jgi:glycosyltransferase involved in cell wall biosynthesis